MRVLFNRCHGENPISCGAEESGELCEFVEVEFFIMKLIESGDCRNDDIVQKLGLWILVVLSTSHPALPLITHQPRQLACQCADTGENLRTSLICHERLW